MLTFFVSGEGEKQKKRPVQIVSYVFSHKIFVVEKSTTSHFTQQLACVD
jgi:hypothetical protein